MRPTLYQLSQPSNAWSPPGSDHSPLSHTRLLIHEGCSAGSCEISWIRVCSEPDVCKSPASVAEWLRRQTQVLVLVEGVSSNLTGCSKGFLFAARERISVSPVLCHPGRPRPPACAHSSSFFFSHLNCPSFSVRSTARCSRPVSVCLREGPYWCVRHVRSHSSVGRALV
jgi:hypothetical protein